MADIDIPRVDSGEQSHISDVNVPWALIEGAVNDVGEDQFADGKIFPFSQLQDGGALQGQGLAWDGSNWSPATLGNIIVPAWTSFTPTLRGSTSNPSLGSGGANTGRYIQVGKLVVGQFRILWGTGGSGGSGFLSVDFPVVPRNTSSNQYCYGAGLAVDAGTANYHIRWRSDGLFMTEEASFEVLSATSPFSIGASGDQILMWFMYEAA